MRSTLAAALSLLTEKGKTLKPRGAAARKQARGGAKKAAEPQAPARPRAAVKPAAKGRTGKASTAAPRRKTKAVRREAAAE